jgi:hypothetical protein
MQNCAYCGRENADDAAQCGACGTALATAASPPSLPTAEKPERTAAEKRMINGALWCLGGIMVSGVSYIGASGPSGGTYVITWGAILFGAIQFFRGISRRDEQPNADEEGYEDLAYATKLETQGRVQEALRAYQQIAETYPDSAVAHDAEKSLDLLRAKVGC